MVAIGRILNFVKSAFYVLLPLVMISAATAAKVCLVAFPTLSSELQVW